MTPSTGARRVSWLVFSSVQAEQGPAGRKNHAPVTLNECRQGKLGHRAIRSEEALHELMV
jgi:hypothetical protein